MKSKNQHSTFLSMIFCLLILFIWNPTSTNGIESTIDSLERVFENYPNQDTVRRDILAQIIQLVNYKTLYKAKRYNKEMVELAEVLEDEILKGNAHNNLGVHYSMTGDFEIGLQHFLESLKIQEKLDNKNDQIKTQLNIGGVYYEIKEFDTSLEHLQAAMRLNEEFGDSIILMNIKQGMANNWIAKGDIVAEDQPTLAKDYYKNAYDNFNEAFEYYKSLDEQKYILPCLNNLAKLSIKRKEFEKALTYLNESLSISKTQFFPLWRAAAFNTKGELELKQGNYNLAEQDFLIANQIVEEHKVKPIELSITNNLVKFYATNGDFEKFQKYYRKAEELKSNLFSEEKTNALFNAQEKFKSELKEQENIILAGKNKLLKSRNLLQSWVAGSFMFLLLVGGFAYFRLQKQKRIIQKQNDELEILNNTKDRLFSIIGHDLRGPALSLQGIGTKINYLFSTKQYDRLRDFGNDIEKSVTDLNNLLNNLLYWAIQNKEFIGMEAELFDFQEAILENLQLIQSLSDKKLIELTTDIENNLTVYANRQAFQTICRNLLNNAIKFTPQQGKIEIIAKRENQKIKFTVKDNGIGIAKEQLSTLFDMSYNKATPDTNGNIGTGLGLNICKELALINNGDIEVSSLENLGSTFTLILPACKEVV